MRMKEYTRQIEKRQRITGGTLVIGIDIGSEFNAVCLMDKEGDVIGKYPRIYNSRKGFDYFHTIVEQAKRKRGCTDVIIGMEPTGHYWRKIGFFALDKGYQVRFVRTTALKAQRELDESSPAKSDIRDAFTIANIVREGKYIDTVIEESVFRELRTLAHTRERIVRYNTGCKHALKAVLDDYFPELVGAFWSMKSKGLWSLLETYPFPENVVQAGLPALTELLAKSTRRKVTAREKAEKVYQAAQESVGLKAIGNADRARLAISLSEVRRSEERLKEIEHQIMDLLHNIPLAAHILSIPGIGAVTCGVFLGELGNPDYFKDPRQIVKYAGYDPKEHDSGLRTGGRIISKKGRWLLRKYLYFMAMRVVHRSVFFKGYYEHKQKGALRPLAKKEALCAVIVKLIRVIFALIRDKRIFTEDITAAQAA
jgi:transposase